MRIAAVYDIHANLPALETVLEDIRKAEIDQLIVGGDVFPGLPPVVSALASHSIRSPGFVSAVDSLKYSCSQYGSKVLYS